MNIIVVTDWAQGEVQTLPMENQTANARDVRPVRPAVTAKMLLNLGEPRTLVALPVYRRPVLDAFGVQEAVEYH